MRYVKKIKTSNKYVIQGNVVVIDISTASHPNTHTLIDISDIKILTIENNFNAINSHHIKYCIRTGANKKLLHRLLLDPPSDMVIDHINGNALDNRRENIRVCTISENLKNRKMASHNKSGFKGVYLDDRKKKYRAVIYSNKKKYSLGSYNTKVEAALAYDLAAIKMHGQFARTNASLGLFQKDAA